MFLRCIRDVHYNSSSLLPQLEWRKIGAECKISGWPYYVSILGLRSRVFLNVDFKLEVYLLYTAYSPFLILNIFVIENKLNLVVSCHATNACV